MDRPKRKFMVDKRCLSLLRKILKLSHNSNRTHSVVFVSIDFENAESIWQDTSSEVGCEIGIAILDTGWLDDIFWRGLAHEYCRENAERLITAYHFVTGPFPYLERRATRFCFGDTTCINSEDMREKIQSCIPQGRKIILVGHGIGCDLIALEALGIDFEPGSLLAVVDTYWVAQEVFLSKSRHSLKSLLQRLRIDHSQSALHCAGNDAHLTLRALLLLVAEAYSSHVELPMQSRWAKRRNKRLKMDEMERGYLAHRRAAFGKDSHYAAQRDTIAKLLAGYSVLDLLGLDDPWQKWQGVATAKVQNQDDDLEEGDLRWLEIPSHGQGRSGDNDSESRNELARPWGLDWVLMREKDSTLCTPLVE